VPAAASLIHARLARSIRAAETGLLSILLLGIVGLALAQILLREVFLSSVFWADELIRLAVLWIAMIGSMVASREARHIAIGIVPRYFPKSWHRPSQFVAMAFAAAISTALAWQAFRFVADERRFGETVLGDLPAWMFELIMPFGFAVIAVRFLGHAASSLKSR
jgi:TRAP-type C4-dicarboxylate transport system permease small subunit